MKTEEADRIEAEAQKESEEAVDYAVASPEPELSELMKDIYVPFNQIS